MSIISSGVEVGVYVNNLELIHSGIVNLKTNEMIIKILDLEINISFEQDKENNKIRIDGEKTGIKSLKLVVKNMNSPLLQGFYEPIEIGNINNRKVYLNISGWTIGENNSARTIIYNLFYEKAV